MNLNVGVSDQFETTYKMYLKIVRGNKGKVSLCITIHIPLIMYIVQELDIDSLPNFS